MNMFRRGPAGFESTALSELKPNILRLYMKCFSALCSFLFWYIF